MRITKTLTRKPHQAFYWDNLMHSGLCIVFIGKLLNDYHTKIKSVTVTLSSKNPKRNGYKKIMRKGVNKIMIDDLILHVCYDEEVTLNDAGIKIGDNFWMKATR